MHQLFDHLEVVVIGMIIGVGVMVVVEMRLMRVVTERNAL